MAFRRGGAKHRRDAAEPAIVHALNALGVTTWQLHGTGLPDLLCFHRGRFLPLEVKSAKGQLTGPQVGIPWPVVRSVDEACQALGLTAYDRSPIVAAIARNIAARRGPVA